MDTMELLKQLGCVEPADQEVLARTANALLELAAAEKRRPTVGVTAPFGRVVRLIGGSDVAGGPVSSSADRADGSHRQRQRRWVARVAALAVLVAAAGGAGVLLEPGTPAGPGTAAAAVLKKLAHVAAYQPAPIVPGPGQYLYVDSVEAYTDTAGTSPNGGAGYTVLLPENRQIWIAANGSGRILETFGDSIFLSAQDRANWEAAGSPPIQHPPTDMSFGPGGLVDGPTNLSELPTNPSALAAEISSRKIEGGPPGPAEDFTQVADMLRETDASPALRSALYQVAAGLPGVEALKTVTDHSGRSGVGIAYVNKGLRHELIFDPKTSALLGEYYTIVGPGSGYDAPVGTVVGREVYLQSSVVNSLPSAPATAPSQPVVPATPAPSNSAVSSNWPAPTTTTLAP
jgi:hypothetical protein